MTVLRDAMADPTGAEPPPVSLETLAVIEQVIGEALRRLRGSIVAPPTRDPGAVEYASWLRGRDD